MHNRKKNKNICKDQFVHMFNFEKQKKDYLIKPPSFLVNGFDAIACPYQVILVHIFSNVHDSFEGEHDRPANPGYRWPCGSD